MSRPPAPLLVTGVVTVVFVALPFIGLLSDVPWRSLDDALTDPVVGSALGVTAVVVPISTVVVIVFGTPFAWLLSRYAGRWAGFARALVLVPIVLPPVVSGLVLLSAFGRRGLVGRALESAGIVLPFSLAGAVLAAVFVSLPFYVIAVEEGFRSVPSTNLDAARSLGTPERAEFLRVAVPHARPAILAGTVLAASRALGEFGATITFAGNLEGSTRTLPLATFSALESDPAIARVIGLLLVAIAVGVIFSLRGALLRR